MEKPVFIVATYKDDKGNRCNAVLEVTPLANLTEILADTVYAVLCTDLYDARDFASTRNILEIMNGTFYRKPGLYIPRYASDSVGIYTIWDDSQKNAFPKK